MRKSRIVNAPTDTPTPADSAPTPPEPAASPPGPGRAGDVWGAVASMLVALPSAIAYGVLVFTAVSPEHAGMGALAGALGAAALGLTAPIIGRNGGLVTAPCAPAAAVMSGLAAALAARGDLEPARIVALLFLAALISAVLQAVYGAVKLGRFIKYLPFQVVSGYLSGVAVLIFLSQVPKLLGLPTGTSLAKGLVSPSLWSGPGLAVGLVTIVVTGGAPKLTTKVPGAILGLLSGVATYFLIAWLGSPDLLTLEGNSLVIGTIGVGGDLVGVTIARIKGLLNLGAADVGLVLTTAVTLSALLSIDTLKTGVLLDAMTRTRHASNRELIAQGVANAVSALAGGLPGAGTTGATLVNVTSGGRTPLSAILEGILCVVAVLTLGPLIAWVPIGALAGILLVVAFKMMDWKAFRLILQSKTRLDFAVIAAVIAVAVGKGLIAASVTGVCLAILLFIRAQMRGSVVLRRRDLTQVESKRRRLAAARKDLDASGHLAAVVELQGDLFFGTTDQLYTELTDDLQQRRYILLDLRRVQSVDYSGGRLLNVMQQQLAERGGSLLIAGLPSSMGSRQDIERYLGQLGLVGDDDGIPVFETRNEALEWMEECLLAAAGWGPERLDTKQPLTLGEIELFREFEPAMLEKLQAVVREVHLAEGETLFPQGDEGDELFLIRRGTIDVLLPLPGGKRHHLTTFGQGDYFGEMGFLDRDVRSADAEARTECDLYAVSRERFDEVARTDALIGTLVFARLALAVSQRLRSANGELRALEDR